MARQFKPVDRDTEMLLPHNMLDWVPEGHAVRVVIGTVESVVTADLAARLVPPAPKGSAAGPARYDPVMLLTVWLYAYLRGVLSTRAVEDRCRYDATFRVACGRAVPDHTTLSRFRKYLLAQDGLAEELFYRVLRVCACAGLGRLSVVAGDGVKIAASASKEASRTEAGLRKLAGQVMAGARKAAADEDADKGVLPGTDLLLGADTAPGPDPRSRAGRVLACLHELEGEREAADAAAREQGKAYLQALAAGTAAGRGRPRPPWPLPPRSCGWRRPSPPRRPCSRTGRRAAPPGSGSPARPPPPAPARRPARPAPAWKHCRPRPPPRRRPPRRRGRGNRPGTGRPGRGATSPTRTPGCCRCAAAGSPRDTTARTPRPTTGSCSAATPARTPATPSRPAGSPPWRRKAPRSSRPAMPAMPPTPAWLAECHARLCTLPEQDQHTPDHDIAACHAAMTSGAGVFVADAGYHSQANLEAPGPNRLFADAKTRDLARREPAEGPPPDGATPVGANAWRLATPEGRAAYKRRAPDVEGLHASLKDDGGLRRFSLRGLHNATSEFLFAGLAHNLRLLAAVS